MRRGALAHIAARKGYRARYVGVRRNLFDLRRSAAIQNLEGIHRLASAASPHAITGVSSCSPL
jgi:hypothetical protein